MRPLRILVLIPLALLTLAAAKLQTPPFEDEIQKFEAEDKVAPPAPGAVLFVGSSSIRKWTSLAEDFPEYRTLNRGFGGSRIDDSVRYANRIVTPYRPRAIVFYAGTNDLAAGDLPQKVLNSYQTFVAKVRLRVRIAPIAFISIAPAPSRWKNVANIRRANSLVKSYVLSHKGLYYIDIFPLMLDSKGEPRPELFVQDQLHMQPSGYAIWTKEVRKTLRKMLPLTTALARR